MSVEHSEYGDNMRRAEFRGARMVMGNDALSAHMMLVNVARAMFANEGIDLATVRTFRARVTRNRDNDALGGDPEPLWDAVADVLYPAPSAR